MVVMGTRPEAIKLCPVVRELRARNREFETLVCATGQHKELLEGALRVFDVIPDCTIPLVREGNGLSSLTAILTVELDRAINSHRPDLVLVQGDTATAYAAALAAFYRGILVGHIEAGLRTYRMREPFPEEFHRRAITLISEHHFAPTVDAMKNLIREGIDKRQITVTGNTVVDALRYTLNECAAPHAYPVPKGQRLVIFTAHRRESLGPPLEQMLSALRRLVEAYPDITVIFPLHPNPEVRRVAFARLSKLPRVRMIEPPSLVTFHHLLSRAYLVMTDSGGIQEETVALGIPTVVMRYASERTEGVRAGVLRLAGSSEEGIFNLTHRLLEKNSKEYLAMRHPSVVYGDGCAARRIADYLSRLPL